MAWRKLSWLMLLVVCLLVSSPVAADEGKALFWSQIWHGLVAIFTIGEEGTASGAAPPETTADDSEIVPCIPVGG